MARSKKNDDESSLEGPSTIIEPEDSVQNDETPLQEEKLDNENKVESDHRDKKRSFFRRIFGFANIYFVMFIIMLSLVAGVVFVTLKSNLKNNKPASKTQTLSDKQISDLKGNTTLVGDAQQTLDIQGNSIFEGQVLMRGNADIAGSLKVGGSLSLPAITVGGSSTFGQIQVTDRLSVNGNTTLQGQLSVQKGITVSGQANFGSLSASKLTVSTLQLTGDFVVSRHISVTGGTPSRSGGSALGSGGTASVNGTDTSGTITINTGGSPPAGCFATVAFTQRFSTTPHVVISPSNSSASALDYYTNRSISNFSVCTSNAPSASTTYVFDYIAID
jgi:cytoskeletal protein CcmA (bactofilin family)